MDLKRNIEEAINSLEEKHCGTTYAIFGTQENLDLAKDYIPDDVKQRVVPSSWLPEGSKDKLIIVPLDLFDVDIYSHMY